MVHHYLGQPSTWFSLFSALLIIGALIGYPLMAQWTNKRFKQWPLQRYALWSMGVLAAGAAIVGPLAERSHSSFQAHMIGHLLLGMLAPILLLYGKPMTLLLRSLPRTQARRLSRLLHSNYVSVISHPVSAALLNFGGLYIVYRTDVFIWMHQSTFVYALVHIHILLAGYLFTMAILYVDITPHRHSHLFRAVVLIIAFAAHKILAKSLYASAPAGVGASDGEQAALIMYYGGDFIDLAIILLFCYGWYKATAPGRIARSV